MAEIGFYHLLSMPLERALPRLLERARGQGHRVVVRAASAERVEHLNALLWTYDDTSFLAHGSTRDGNPERQPIWLSEKIIPTAPRSCFSWTASMPRYRVVCPLHRHADGTTRRAVPQRAQR